MLLRISLALFGLMLLFPLASIAQQEVAPAQAGPTQRQWMAELVDGLGWSFGLSDEPEDEDYLRILGGNRIFRLEAEDVHHPDDLVGEKNYITFGPYSGRGWASGISRPVTIRLQTLLPLGGSYRVGAALRRPGHTVRLGGQGFAVDGGHRFAEHDLGVVELAAGPLEIEVDLPAGGGLDYLQLEAPPYLPVSPLEGWQPDGPLYTSDLAVTAVRALGMEMLLPPSGEESLYQAEPGQKGVAETTLGYLGAPSEGVWVRAGNHAVVFDFPFQVPEDGIYSLTLRGAWGRAVTVRLDDHYLLSAGPSPSLRSWPLGTFPLQAGDHSLSINLPPFGGVDTLLLRRHLSSATDYRRLAGLPQKESAADVGMMARLLEQLAGIGIPR